MPAVNAVGFVCGFLLLVVLVVTAVNWSIDAAADRWYRDFDLVKRVFSHREWTPSKPWYVRNSDRRKALARSRR